MIRTLGAATVAVLCLSASPKPAEACGGAVFEALVPTRALMVKAERAFEKGQYLRVVELLDDGRVIRSRKTHLRRMELVALSNLRLGRVRAARLSLAYLAKENAKDVRIQARYAEALARTPGRRAEARQILERLAAENQLGGDRDRRLLASLRPAPLGG